MRKCHARCAPPSVRQMAQCLTLQSTGRPQAGFAHLRPPVTSNVRPHRPHRVSFPVLIPIALLASGLAALLCAFATFDRLVRTEYADHRNSWEADGRPRGFLWSAPECTWFRSAWATNRLSFVWLVSTPRWAIESPECRTYLKRMRYCVLAWSAAVAGLLLFVLLAL